MSKLDDKVAPAVGSKVWVSCEPDGAFNEDNLIIMDQEMLEAHKLDGNVKYVRELTVGVIKEVVLKVELV